MTDSVNGVSGAQGTSAGGGYSGGRFSEGHKKRSAPVPQSDLIEISQDARNRSKSPSRKSLMEYLKELFR